MARIEADATGKVVRLVTANDPLPDPGTHPQSTGTPLTVDDVSNAALVADLQKSTDPYRLTGGVLSKAGVTMTPAADSSPTADRKAVQQNLAAIFAALRAGTATNAQAQRCLAFLLYQYLKG